VDGSTYTATVTGLTVDGNYDCTLFATDSAGNGPSIEWGGQAGPPDATTITAVLSQDGQLTVEYDAVGTSTTGYTVTCGTQTVTVNGSTTWATVPDLTDGTPYSCTVIATNAAGSGPTSPSAAGTPESVSSSPTPSAGGEFIGISCPSTSTCVAVGAAGPSDSTGLVEVSTDGGQTFTDEPVPAGTPELNAVSCVDVLHCTAVGGSTVLVTTDGGTTWTSQYAPQNLSAVTCLSDSVCIAGGGSMGQDSRGSAVMTTDGGESWQSSSDEGVPWSLYSVSCSTSVCIGAGPGLALLLSSTDEGSSWQGFGVPGGIFGEVNSVACLPSTTTCVMVGENALGIEDPNVPALAFITTDDGVSWVSDSSLFPSGTSSMNAIACPTSAVCFAVGYPLTNGGTMVGATTSDGGQTWTSITGPAGVTAVDPDGNDGFGFQNLSCGSASTCVVVGQNTTGPTAAFTTDSAATWTEATSIG
jgi:photosystem II stability/assembly factor-like uncharacterized protein